MTTSIITSTTAAIVVDGILAALISDPMRTLTEFEQCFKLGTALRCSEQLSRELPDYQDATAWSQWMYAASAATEQLSVARLEAEAAWPRLKGFFPSMELEEVALALCARWESPFTMEGDLLALGF